MSISRIGAESSFSLPPGIVVPFAGTTPPDGWLLCQGQAISRSTYASLFGILSTTYGTGDGSTTFNIPNLQGRVPAGKNSAGTFATLGSTGGVETVTLTAAESGLPSHGHTGWVSIGTVAGHNHGGSTGSSSTTHQHYYNRPNFSSITAANGGGTSVMSPTVTFSNVDTTNNASGQASHTHGINSDGSHSHSGSIGVDNAGGGAASSAHTNLQPYVVLNYIIKT